VKENLGKYYDKSSGFQEAQFQKLIKLMRDNVDCDRVRYLLDIGAGTGIRTEQLLDVCLGLERITAIEPDPEILSVATTEHMSDRIEYHPIAAHDLDTFDESERCFDVVFSNWALHWVLDKDKLMEDVNRLTPPDARFVFSSCEKLPHLLMDIDEYVRSELLLPKSRAYPWEYFDVEGWTQFLNKHGWAVKAQKTHLVYRTVDDAKTYLDDWFAASTSKFLYGQQMEQLTDLSLSDLVWLMQKKYPHPELEEGLFFAEDTMFIVAEKI